MWLFQTPRRSLECQENLWVFYSTFVPAREATGFCTSVPSAETPTEGTREQLAEILRHPPPITLIYPSVILFVRVRVEHMFLQGWGGEVKMCRREEQLEEAGITILLPLPLPALITSRFCIRDSA